MPNGMRLDMFKYNGFDVQTTPGVRKQINGVGIMGGGKYGKNDYELL